MPVIALSYSRLQKLIGKVSKKQISDSLPFLGLDIESEDKNLVRVEYSPNRPDYSTDIGIALGLQGILGIKTGALKLKLKKSNEYAIHVKSNVSKIRPFVTGLVAKNGKINEEILEQFIQMQEDLHMGIGRKRKKSSIGIHTQQLTEIQNSFPSNQQKKVLFLKSLKVLM
jgi:phenylalanyl-tRNA synthetase beta chain